MDIRRMVARYYAEWVADKGASWTECMTKALEDQAANHAIELRAYEATVANLEAKVRELETATINLFSQTDRNQIIELVVNYGGKIANAYTSNTGKKCDAYNAEGREILAKISAMLASMTEQAAKYEQQIAPLKMELKCIAEQLNDPRENLTHSTAQCIASLQERIRQLEAELVPDGWMLVPSRCPLCEYQYGHQIGCENNPVDIAMLAAAPQPKEGE